MGLKLKIKQGSTYSKQLRWEVEPFFYRPITLISNSAPCALHVPAHGLLPDQLFCIQSATGLETLNAHDPEEKTDWYRATVIDVDHIQINRINSLLMKPHTAGSGVIKYRSVVDLNGYKAFIHFRDRVGGTILYTLSSDLGNIVLDTVLQSISIIIPDEISAAFAWKKGVYDLDMVSSGGVVTTILSGDIVIEKETTVLTP